MNIIGYDNDGVTQKSLQTLEFYNKRKLVKVIIEAENAVNCKTYFVFDGDDAYRASGFSIGYGGEGPNGLYKAIKMFYPDKIEDNFWESPISKLEYHNWEWTPHSGFIPI